MPEPEPVTTAMWDSRRPGMGVSSAFGFELSIQTKSKLQGQKRKALPARCTHSAWRCPMDRQLREWKFSVERLWSAAAPDYYEAARLAADIASASEEAILRQAATQALPILRSASSEDADQSTRDAARRRLGVIREVLHTLTTPTFGKRGNSPKLLTSEERYRQMLGLPHGPRLSAPEIHQAWKRAAKIAHPDGGGSTQRFQE